MISLYSYTYICNYTCICIMCIRKCLFIDDASLSLFAKRKKLIDSTGVYINTYIHYACISMYVYFFTCIRAYSHIVCP